MKKISTELGPGHGELIHVGDIRKFLGKTNFKKKLVEDKVTKTIEDINKIIIKIANIATKISEKLGELSENFDDDYEERPRHKKVKSRRKKKSKNYETPFEHFFDEDVRFSEDDYGFDPKDMFKLWGGKNKM